MRHPRRLLALPAVLLALSAVPARAQAGGQAAEALPPGGYGSLKQDDLALRVRTVELDVRFVPLDLRVTSLLGRDSYQSLHSLVQSRRQAIDSLARAAGIGHPGLALVTFFGLRSGARFDPQILTVAIRNQVFRPLGIVPFTPRFTSQQLEVRDQVSAIFLFEEQMPVSDDFQIAYGGQTSENWARKRPMLERERARVASRARVERADSAPPPRPAVSRNEDAPAPEELPADTLGDQAGPTVVPTGDTVRVDTLP